MTSEIGEEKEGLEVRYVCMASDFQLPCFLMNSSGTPFWKAQDVPALLHGMSKVGIFGVFLTLILDVFWH